MLLIHVLLTLHHNQCHNAGFIAKNVAKADNCRQLQKTARTSSIR